MGVFIVDDEKIAEALEDKVRIDILVLLKRKGELHVNKISQLLHKHRSTITRHLTKLVEAELIEKVPSQSGYVYRLTSKGDKVLEDLQEGGFTIRVKPQKQNKQKLLYYAIVAILAAMLLYIAITPISIHALTRIIIIVPLAYILYILIKKSKEMPALKQD